MKTYSVHDKAIVLVLTKREAAALKKRFKLTAGLKGSKLLSKVEEKLLVELGYI